MGKAYANRKPVNERPESDFYPTPGFLTEALLKSYEFTDYIEALKRHCNRDKRQPCILEPACGDGAITKVLQKHLGFCDIISHDIRTDGVDFLTYTPERKIDMVITNPPFSLFDEFVKKAKEIAPVVIFIGKVNFFGAYNRHRDGVWDNLRDVMVFNRQVDYRTGSRDDGKFHCGNLVTGWFIWHKCWTAPYWSTQIMDVQDGVVKREVRK